MTTQITVRLPDALVSFLDQQVAAGKVSSRAALVTDALERAQRRQAAEHDAQVLSATGPEDDLDPLVHWSMGAINLED